MTRTAALLPACILLASCASEAPPLSITDLSVTAPVPGRNVSAAYFTLTNSTAEPITITRVASAEYSRVEMHETMIQDGVARMRRLDAITVSPGMPMAFERGARHLMLMQPAGTPARVTLDFYAGADLLLTVSTNVQARD